MTIKHVNAFVACRQSAGTQDIVDEVTVKTTVSAYFGLTKTSEVAHLSSYMRENIP